MYSCILLKIANGSLNEVTVYFSLTVSSVISSPVLTCPLQYRKRPNVIVPPPPPVKA